jgi:hypothetical protein
LLIFELPERRFPPLPNQKSKINSRAERDSLPKAARRARLAGLGNRHSEISSSSS